MVRNLKYDLCDFYSNFKKDNFIKGPYMTKAEYKTFIDSMEPVYLFDVEIDKYDYDVDYEEYILDRDILAAEWVVEHSSLFELVKQDGKSSKYAVEVPIDDAKVLMKNGKGVYPCLGNLTVDEENLRFAFLSVLDPKSYREYKIVKSEMYSEYLKDRSEKKEKKRRIQEEKEAIRRQRELAQRIAQEKRKKKQARKDWINGIIGNLKEYPQFILLIFLVVVFAGVGIYTEFFSSQNGSSNEVNGDELAFEAASNSSESEKTGSYITTVEQFLRDSDSMTTYYDMNKEYRFVDADYKKGIDSNLLEMHSEDNACVIIGVEREKAFEFAGSIQFISTDLEYKDLNDYKIVITGGQGIIIFGDEREEIVHDFDELALNIVASSVFSETIKGKTIVYESQNLLDYDYQTPWIEAHEGDGINERIVITSTKPGRISSLGIVNGFTKYPDTYRKNNRIKSLKIIFDGDDSYSVTYFDLYMGLQNVEFDEPIIASHVELIITDVYEGYKYEDTCIGEIIFNAEEHEMNRDAYYIESYEDYLKKKVNETPKSTSGNGTGGSGGTSPSVDVYNDYSTPSKDTYGN